MGTNNILIGEGISINENDSYKLIINQDYPKIDIVETMSEREYHLIMSAISVSESILKKAAKPKIKKEFIVCSAVMFHGHTVICGRRHKDCYNIIENLGFDTDINDDRKNQGFVTSKNRFVNRSEAFIIAKDNNQIYHTMFDDVIEGELTSEDLYGIDDL